MKNKMLVALSAISCLALSGNVSAQENAGGYTGPSVEVISVDQAKGMSDDTFVVLRGNISQNIGEETYIFTDASGNINVEIDDEIWNGTKVGAADMVEIRGEVDKGWSSVEIDVQQLNKISQ